MFGSRNTMRPVISSPSKKKPTTNHFFAACAQASWSACEIVSLISGTVTFAGCFVGSRKIPTWSAETEHFQVNESTVATRLHGNDPISTRKFEHSHAFCFGPILPLLSSPVDLNQRTCSASNSTSKYAASVDEPSSFGMGTEVTSARWNSRRDIAL